MKTAFRKFSIPLAPVAHYYFLLDSFSWLLFLCLLCKSSFSPQICDICVTSVFSLSMDRSIQPHDSTFTSYIVFLLCSKIKIAHFLPWGFHFELYWGHKLNICRSSKKKKLKKLAEQLSLTLTLPIYQLCHIGHIFKIHSLRLTFLIWVIGKSD